MKPGRQNVATWTDSYNCTDCGKGMDRPGTCDECKVAEQKADEAIRRDLAKVPGKGKGRRK
jgi:hypothetical protein